jgi:hypothetical protein
MGRRAGSQHRLLNDAGSRDRRPIIAACRCFAASTTPESPPPAP